MPLPHIFFPLCSHLPLKVTQKDRNMSLRSSQKLIFSLRMFTRLGSSSMAVALSIPPTFVTLGSFSITTTSCLSPILCHIVRNFMTLKGLLFSPHLSWKKRTGPGSSKYIASEKRSHKGDERTSPSNARETSNALLK